MPDVLTNLWSWSLLIGIVIGFVLSKIWCLVKTHWLNKHRPLPDGRKRSLWRSVATDRRWLIGMIAVAFLGWSVVTTSDNAADNQRNATQAAAFAQRVQDCQAVLIEAINRSREVTATNERISKENDELSREERTLLADGQRFLVEWIGALLDPRDPNVRGRLPNDPVRQEYNIDVTRGFFDKAGAIGKRIDEIHAQQDANERSRPATRPALPEPNCGE